MSQLSDCLQQLHDAADPDYRTAVLRWFKTAPGQYAAHDRFLGVSMPKLRALEKSLQPLCAEVIEALLLQPENEARMLAWLALVRHYRSEPETTLALAWRWRLQMNNWNLVDTAAPHLFGRELLRTPTFANPLEALTASDNLWERRISIVSCLYPVRQGELAFCLQQAEKLLGDSEDLIHKAIGWLLREVGKQDRARLQAFLDAQLRQLPRTSLRYAIERFSAEERRYWLAR